MIVHVYEKISQTQNMWLSQYVHFIGVISLKIHDIEQQVTHLPSDEFTVSRHLWDSCKSHKNKKFQHTTRKFIEARRFK